jgi:hypothetical protein
VTVVGHRVAAVVVVRCECGAEVRIEPDGRSLAAVMAEHRRAAGAVALERLLRKGDERGS